MSEDEPEYALVMPFVVCASNGGPFDDSAFVNGAAYGALDAKLSLSWLQGHAEYVDPRMVPQFDLLAMHHGFTLTVEPWEDFPDDWVLARFVRDSAQVQGEPQ